MMIYRCVEIHLVGPVAWEERAMGISKIFTSRLSRYSLTWVYMVQGIESRKATERVSITDNERKGHGGT